MAFRNLSSDEVTRFGSKLFSMMVDHNMDTPRKLATALYDAGLVTVKTNTENLNDHFQNRSNAIGSIEKKIRKHLYADSPSCLQGEFVLAYCKFFDCSADYLFSNTSIKSGNSTIRDFCEATGLNENIVQKLVDAPDDFTKMKQTAIWNVLMSEVMDSIGEEYNAIVSEVMDYCTTKEQLTKVQYLLNNSMNLITSDSKCDLENKANHLQEDLVSHRSAYNGNIYKVSRMLSDAIDDYFQHTMLSGPSMDERISEAKSFANNIIQKLPNVDKVIF